MQWPDMVCIADIAMFLVFFLLFFFPENSFLKKFPQITMFLDFS